MNLYPAGIASVLGAFQHVSSGTILGADKVLHSSLGKRATYCRAWVWNYSNVVTARCMFLSHRKYGGAFLLPASLSNKASGQNMQRALDVKIFPIESRARTTDKNSHYKHVRNCSVYSQLQRGTGNIAFSYLFINPILTAQLLSCFLYFISALGPASLTECAGAHTVKQRHLDSRVQRSSKKSSWTLESAHTKSVPSYR